MTINWKDIPEVPAINKVIAALRLNITYANYGFEEGQWNLTDLIQETDTRKYIAYHVLEGIDQDRKKDTSYGVKTDMGTDILFKFRVHTRQACCRDKDGHKVWLRQEAKDNVGNPGDIVPNYEEKPKTGDIVEWKANRKYTDERGQIVDQKIKKRWALQGIRPDNYIEFRVDKDGCIQVPYPYALAMLRNKGKRLSFPQFRKVNKHSK